MGWGGSQRPRGARSGDGLKAVRKIQRVNAMRARDSQQNQTPGTEKGQYSQQKQKPRYRKRDIFVKGAYSCMYGCMPRKGGCVSIADIREGW